MSRFGCIAKSFDFCLRFSFSKLHSVAFGSLDCNFGFMYCVLAALFLSEIAQVEQYTRQRDYTR